MTKPVALEVRAQWPVGGERAFDVVATSDASTIHAGSGRLAAAVGIEEADGAWDSVGESRIVRLADGTGWIETLMAYERPVRLAYAIVAPTNFLGLLVRTIRAEWRFEESVVGGASSVVEVRWRNELVGRSRWTRPLLWVVAHWIWRPEMERGIERAGEQVLAGAS